MGNRSRGDIKQQLQQMDPYEFEELIAELWGLQGYETTVRQASSDRGIDVEATKETPFKQKVLIQAKRYADGNKVGSKEVRNYATLYQQVPDADNVVIVTTNEFTNEAERLANDLNVKTVDSTALLRLIEDEVIEDFGMNAGSEDTLGDVDNISPENTLKDVDNIGSEDTNEDFLPPDFDDSPEQLEQEGTSSEFQQKDSTESTIDTEVQEENKYKKFDVSPSMMEPTKDHDYRSTCSNCGSNEIWYTEKPNQKARGRDMQRLLKCYSCGRLWGEEQKGIIRKSYEWKVYKKGE